MGCSYWNDVFNWYQQDKPEKFQSFVDQNPDQNTSFHLQSMMLDEIQSVTSLWSRRFTIDSDATAVFDAIESWRLKHDPKYRRIPQIKKTADSAVERAAMWIAVAVGSMAAAGVIWMVIRLFIQAAIARVRERSRLQRLKHRMRASTTLHLFSTMPPAIERRPCSICHDEYEPHSEVIELRCGHCFHSKCIVLWFTRCPAETCPMCRQPMEAATDRHSRPRPHQS